MAGVESLPGLQADAATSWAEIARDPIKAAQELCNNPTFERIKQLLKHEEMHIAHPISELLDHLSKCPEAKPLLSTLPLEDLKSYVGGGDDRQRRSVLVRAGYRAVLNLFEETKDG